ncbi:cytosine permease [Amycolatopsis rubida]|uniref:Cytosine permease n=1 Tax=Amycolatopsis rubida TaxID=112413 RepID=A0ABX0BQE9_9PSEU|nr:MULTISPECIES: cytosine permease [Amycolatopsis]MYW92830.1 cytosine permease [Amycolatopsis rubida]NEC57816.1 cytosine permease [Amycolatopsis rubida]OAP21247.1 Permease for cytosine/purines, uracil, thiamine, allantoin [Amycolatopsis sp. M39]
MSGIDAEVFGGRMPSGAGDFAIETHGITPIPPANRFGRPWRLAGVWFAPNLTMTAVFTGTLGATLGLGFTTGFVIALIGTVVGSLPVAWLSTWGPRTGTGQLPLARLPFGRGVVLPGLVQWLGSIAWDALVGLFGGEALAQLTGLPFWAAVLVVLVLQCTLGVFGYAVIHRVQAVMSVVLVVAFVALAVKVVLDHPITFADSATGGDFAGAVVLFSTITLSLAISWAPYASDFSRYLPASTRPSGVFWFTLLGLTASYALGEGIGLALGTALGDQTAAGVSTLLGGGVLGAVALLVIALAAVSSNAMNDYSGSLALQTVGVRVRRPVSAVVVTVLAFALILWMHSGDLAAKFQNVLLVVSYWIPPFLGVVVPDWLRRTRRGREVDVLAELRRPVRSWAALAAFVAGFAAAVPFMNTTVYTGPVAAALHGADLAYYAGFVVSLAAYTLLRGRRTVDLQ